MNFLNIGFKGENVACKYLKSKKYKILKTNYRKKYGEIDIIVQKKNTIVFVEVKTRKSIQYGMPCEFVTKSKQTKLINTAKLFIYENQLDCDFRFDIIEVYHDNGKINKIEHIENAFC